MRLRAVFTALALSSCAVVRPLTASNADVADHRAFALARYEGDRLRRAAVYLERHPDGAWAPDVRAAFDREEPKFYADSQKSRDAALDYLAWLPRGPHADAAVALLQSFAEAQPEDEASRMVRAARENEARLERAAEERQAAEDAALESLRVVIDASAYGKKLSDDGELSRFLLAGRSIGHTPSSRTRYRRFTVPTRSGALDRELEITVAVERTDDDVVTAATVSGPGLFERMAEASLLRAVGPAEAERWVRDAVDAMARARGAGLRIHFEPDRIRIEPAK